MAIIISIIGFVGLGILLMFYVKNLFSEMQNNVNKLITEIGDDVKEALVINQSVNERVKVLEDKLKQLEG